MSSLNTFIIHIYIYAYIFHHQKEEKHLDTSLDELIHRVRELKQSINGFIYKLENEYQNINW